MRLTILCPKLIKLMCALQIFIEPGHHARDLIDLVFAFHEAVALLRIVDSIHSPPFLLQDIDNLRRLFACTRMSRSPFMTSSGARSLRRN
jgi:hypothetical protein